MNQEIQGKTSQSDSGNHSKETRQKPDPERRKFSSESATTTQSKSSLKTPNVKDKKIFTKKDDKKSIAGKQDHEKRTVREKRSLKIKENKANHQENKFACPKSDDLGWVNRSCVNDQAVKGRIQDLLTSRLINADHQVEWLARSIQCIDLTTLAGDDCPSNVARLCSKAAYPLSDSIASALHIENGLLTTGAVCVYPARVADACLGLERLGANIPVASVATGFPTGQTSLKIRLAEIEFAVQSGAKEIDIVINRELALAQNWKELYNELVQMRKACGESHMKSILAVGELCNLTNVYRASLVAMMAGSDFIKTSTGKETVNATLPIGLVMCRAIRAYNRKTGFKVGFKPAGGIRTSKDVLQWMTLMKEELGDDYLTPEFFRIGASALLNDIERNLAGHFTEGYFLAEEMPMA
uniref:deoxyribose-phosphate aldolase n=1 Tax=Daphnia longispina TaxID=42846 RepID=A0A4Y7M7E3_9CRUS|nr:EOG090X08W6 [Daphnia longispina]